MSKLFQNLQKLETLNNLSVLLGFIPSERRNIYSRAHYKAMFMAKAAGQGEEGAKDLARAAGATAIAEWKQT